MGRAAREPVNVPADAASFMRRRVEVLFQSDRSISDLMCDAYIQGMSDVVALQQRDAQSKDTTHD